MANINITIPSPILVSGQSFNVRYRLLPGGAWVNISPKTNATFQITGISAGQYELEARLNMGGSPAVICPPVYYYFVAEGEYDCVDLMQAEIIRSGQQSSIVIVSNAPSTGYPCGYQVEYMVVGNSFGNVINWTLPPPINLTIPIPTPPSDYIVRIWGVICGSGDRVLCYEDTLEAPTSCDPITIQSPGVSFIQNSSGIYFLRIPFNQSNPPSPTITVNWKQNGIMTSGIPDPGGQQQFNGVSPILVPLTPNTNIQPEVSGINAGRRLLKYSGNAIDQCGAVRIFDLKIAIDEIHADAQPVPTGYINIFVNNYTVGATLTYTIEVRERATSTNIAANGSGRTIASGAGNTINGGNITAKPYNQYDMRITLSSAPYSKVFAAKWNNGVNQNVGSVTVAPAATSSWIQLSDMTGSGGLYVDILDVV